MYLYSIDVCSCLSSSTLNTLCISKNFTWKKGITVSSAWSKSNYCRKHSGNFEGRCSIQPSVSSAHAASAHTHTHKHAYGHGQSGQQHPGIALSPSENKNNKTGYLVKWKNEKNPERKSRKIGTETPASPACMCLVTSYWSEKETAKRARVRDRQIGGGVWGPSGFHVPKYTHTRAHVAIRSNTSNRKYIKQTESRTWNRKSLWPSGSSSTHTHTHSGRQSVVANEMAIVPTAGQPQSESSIMKDNGFKSTKKSPLVELMSRMWMWKLVATRPRDGESWTNGDGCQQTDGRFGRSVAQIRNVPHVVSVILAQNGWNQTKPKIKNKK